MFYMRFDMRAPVEGASTRDLYGAATEMVAWADTRGCASVIVCEHHMTADGYLPSPMILAAALAARTSKTPITIAALPLPLYDPVRLAEEMVVLDILSGGRLIYVTALGYRPEEYEHLGVEFARRGRVADEKLPLLLRAKTGDAFEIQGRHVHVTPPPFTRGGPLVMWGGGSLPAARRAGRNGVGFFGQRDDPALKVAYETAACEAGHEPGMCILPPSDLPTTVFVAEDPDRAWHELGPFLMHDARGYAEWNEEHTAGASLSFARDAAELRAQRRSHQIWTVDEAATYVRTRGPLQLHPLVGGLPPRLAWPYLETVIDKVMPAIGTLPATGSEDHDRVT